MEHYLLQQIPQNNTLGVQNMQQHLLYTSVSDTTELETIS
jgi:hypothetical protein